MPKNYYDDVVVVEGSSASFGRGRVPLRDYHRPRAGQELARLNQQFTMEYLMGGGPIRTRLIVVDLAPGDVEYPPVVGETPLNVLPAGTESEEYPVIVESPPRALPSSLRSEFEMLAAQWKSDTRYTSSIHRIFLHDAYQQIIGMGTPAIPLLLSRLSYEPDLWFWALEAVTRTRPAPGAGSIAEAVQAWQDWARRNGYG